MGLGSSLQSETTEMGERLALVKRDGGNEYQLRGRPIPNGAALELRLADCWVRGRFEWSGANHRWPSLRFALGGPWSNLPTERQPTAAMPLPPDALLRWPTH